MLQDAVEPLDEPCEKLAETIILAYYVSQEMTDASTQVQGSQMSYTLHPTQAHRPPTIGMSKEHKLILGYGQEVKVD